MMMKETGLTWKEIMWRRSWINIQMMLADAPKLIKEPEEKTISNKEFTERIKSRHKQK